VLSYFEEDEHEQQELIVNVNEGTHTGKLTRFLKVCPCKGYGYELIFTDLHCKFDSLGEYSKGDISRLCGKTVFIKYTLEPEKILLFIEER